MHIRLALSTAFAFALISAPTFGCKCASPPPNLTTARDIEQWYADRTSAIFEGSVESVELKWPLMEAKAGTLVSADPEQDPPTLLVTFDVLRSYRGVKQQQVLVTTGVGGGDCGFDFETGKRYLVYASKDEAGHLSTGICSATALLEESQANLAYLRGEHLAAETTERRASINPTKICGHASSRGLGSADNQVFLFRVGSKSPIPSSEADVAQDGSFCIEGTLPGNYYLAFMSRAEDAPIAFVSFPEASSLTEGSPLEIKNGDKRPDLAFNVPTQPTFAVSGKVIIPNQTASPTDCKVFLISADPHSLLVTYSQDVDPSGFFSFPRVLPGKYWAFVGLDSDTATNWLTRKAGVEVSATVNGLTLELVRK